MWVRFARSNFHKMDERYLCTYFKEYFVSPEPPEFNHSSTEASSRALSLRRDDKMASMDTGKNLGIESVKPDESTENEEERWLAEERKTPKKQPIASTSMSSSSTEEKGKSTESQERLATLSLTPSRRNLCVLNPECSEVEIEFQLPEREFTNVFAFQDKLVFIGDSRFENTTGSRRVDMLDISTGQVSSLPDMIKAKCFPVGVGTENEIFVFGTEIWSLLPPMIEERSRCAAVSIPDFGVLVIGGFGRNRIPLHSTELLTRWPSDVRGGGGKKRQWLPYTPMNKEHSGDHLAVYFQERVYVVGCGEYVSKMEILDMATGGQWATLSFSSLPFRIESMATVGNELFVHVFGTPALYSIELDGGLRSTLSNTTLRALLLELPFALDCCYL
ncbi:unnamed protein product [Hymenolepis diminuta]|uniref:Kelch repeat-containing protein n=1 Tax=Hymenolepis diminuta TaxID=6216 RepID=A0A0R3SX54_HYMDI|nr:unnamed protein product [Hymenolepis diminuta]